MRADACFKLMGKYINYEVEQVEKSGRLVQIRIDSSERMLVGIDENGFIEEYEISKIVVSANSRFQGDLTKQIIKRVNRDINSFKFDLSEYYRDRIINILKSIKDEETRNKIIDSLDIASKVEKPEHIYDMVNNFVLNKEDNKLLCGVIAYKQRDRDTAYKIFAQRWVDEQHNLDFCRDFILIADQFDNDVLCFYLLKHFFSIYGKYNNDRYYESLWWKYLYYAIKYNNFDLINNVTITESNVRIILDSFIYIFHMYNLEHIAESLTNCFLEGGNTILQQNNEDLGSIENTIGELKLMKNYLPDTAEGYYLRCESCINKIIGEYPKGNLYKQSDEREGYIYEYVKSRNYGFIIGNDFQKYFYHWEYLTKSIRTKIMENIYSDKAIDEEDKIHVYFRRDSINKKVQAMDII